MAVQDRLDYWFQLVSTPALGTSLFAFVDSKPVFLALYRVIKVVRRLLLGQGSELNRVLRDEVRYGQGFASATGQWTGPISPETRWKADRTIMKSRSLNARTQT